MSSTRAEVRLGLGQLLLGLAPAALVAPHPGDLLEQRPALLGPQRERLVDHALADEQEGVVGEVRGIEQVDEVAQPDPLPVEQVVVLARADTAAARARGRWNRPAAGRRRCRGRACTSAMPSADRRSEPAQMTSSALRDRSARPCSPSAQRRASARLLLPDPFGPTTALMPGPELDVRPLGEGLEALHAEPRSRARPATGSIHDRSALVVRGVGTTASGSTVMRAPPATWSEPTPPPPRAWRPGSARSPPPRLPSRRPGATDPRRSPATSPSTQTSTRKNFSWSGPVASSDAVVGPPAGRRCVSSCSRLFGLLSDPIGCPASSSGPASAMSQSRTGSSRGRDSSAPASASNAEARSDGRRRPLRCGLALAEEQEPPRGRCGRRARARPSSLTIAARRADSTPSSSSGWRAYSASEIGEVDDGIAEELEAFVVAGGLVGVLVQPARVGERLGQEADVADGEPELLRESLPGSHGDRGRARPRRSARRCIRRRPGRSGSSPHPRPRSPSRTPPRGS